MNPFPDPFTTGPQFPADFRENKLQCCPGQSSPLIPTVTLRPLTETVATVQTIYTSRKPVSLATSAETLRQELEREKMMKRLLMTELWHSTLAAWRWHGAFVRFLSSGSVVCSLRHDIQMCALFAQVSRVSGSQLPAWLRWKSYFTSPEHESFFYCSMQWRQGLIGSF